MPNYNVLESRKMSAKELLDELNPSIDGGVSGLGAVEGIESPTLISSETLSEKIGNMERSNIKNDFNSFKFEI